MERYSDDGEPQGTAGQPMLGVFQKEGVVNVCCVVTRYFGGVLLGAGGLVRAYTQSAKDALDAAGISVVRRWVEVTAVCPYSLFERMKLEVEAAGGVLGESEYAADVTVHALLPENAVESFSARGDRTDRRGPPRPKWSARPSRRCQDKKCKNDEGGRHLPSSASVRVQASLYTGRAYCRASTPGSFHGSAMRSLLSAGNTE